MNAAKKYNLTKAGKDVYHKKFTQLAPDLIDGLVPQSTASDIYSYGVLADRVVTSSQVSASASSFKDCVKACMLYHAQSRPNMYQLVTELSKIL